MHEDSYGIPKGPLRVPLRIPTVSSKACGLHFVRGVQNAGLAAATAAVAAARQAKAKQRASSRSRGLHRNPIRYKMCVRLWLNFVFLGIISWSFGSKLCFSGINFMCCFWAKIGFRYIIWVPQV